MSLLSIWDEMDVRAELLADDAWEAEDDKTIFMIFGVDSFDWLYLEIRRISLTMVQISTKTNKYDKWE